MALLAVLSLAWGPLLGGQLACNRACMNGCASNLKRDSTLGNLAAWQEYSETGTNVTLGPPEP